MLKRKTPVHMPIFQQHNNSPLIFLTVCSGKKRSVFAKTEIHNLILTSWKMADKWLVGRYVIMPDHIHLFCSPVTFESPPLGKWIQYWKSISSKNWPRIEEHPVWQKSFWDTLLRKSDGYDSKWEYVRNNPVRAGLCKTPEEWQFQGVMNDLIWYD